MASSLPPGAVIGMLGAGQLGRMTALAAARLGYRVLGFSDRPLGEPLDQVSPDRIVAAWDDEAALARFADRVDVIGYEFENVPVHAARFLEARVPLHPTARLLERSQDRLIEKRWIRSCGVPTAPFAPVDSVDALRMALDELGAPAILKTRRMGYDGKGQARLQGPEDASAAWAALGGVPCIVEGLVSFDCEASVIIASDQRGETRCFPTAKNDHENGILRDSHVPSDLAPAIEHAAQDIARALAKDIGLVGILAVELFVLPDGTLMVNEVAPRTHNSGHWTQDACETSQFEQHVRALVGLPLGPVGLTRPVTMHNLLGDEVLDAPRLLADPDARVHLYGKGTPRPGRKMGHVNLLAKQDPAASA